MRGETYRIYNKNMYLIVDKTQFKIEDLAGQKKKAELQKHW